MSSVSRNVVMLVSDGSMDGTKAASAAQLGTRVVHPDQSRFCEPPPTSGPKTD